MEHATLGLFQSLLKLILKNLCENLKLLQFVTWNLTELGKGKHQVS